MYEKKLSIIIPTKNRQQYAFKCIKTILENTSGKFEIVVVDNSDNDSLKKMLSMFRDNIKIKYSYNPDVISFCANFERGVELSSGDYLIFIGDDDCVFPEIVDLTECIREKGIESVIFNHDTSYIWPNAISENAGRLVIRKQPCFITVKSTKYAWNQMVTKGNYDYQHYSFPKVYHGIIKRDVFDCVKAKTGHYFGGLTPDIYSAVALSFYIDNILYISVPFTLPGTCPKSGSADSLTGKHSGELKDAPHFRGHSEYKWDPDIPYVYSVDTIWAETGFKACKENGKFVNITEDEYFHFFMYIVRRNPEFVDRMARFYCEKVGCSINKIKFKLYVQSWILDKKLFILKCYKYCIHCLNGRLVYNKVNDIGEALEIARNKINNHKMIIEKIRNLNW